ncbi:MAG: hypothetical protein Q8L14_38625 [Myxococcales bacterium]|nr:hypothetical protein [Myxococcales bacterium]
MRSFLTVLVVGLVLVGVEARAKCAGEWVNVSPANEVELPPQPTVLVTLGGRFRKVDLTRDLEFVSGAQRVAVEVVSQFAGYSQVVALVKPVTALPPVRWALTLKKSSKEQLGRALGSWKVGKTVDSVAPAFVGTPSAGATSWSEFGCGPGSSLEVNGVAMNEPNAFVEAKVTVDGKTETAVFAPKEGGFDLGHGMCSGAFDLKPGVTATVVFTPVDVSGNRGASSAAVTFTAPGPKQAR